MKEKGLKYGIGISSIFVIIVICFSLMVTPFVAAYQAISHPITTTIDFVSGLIDLSDSFDRNNNDTELLVSVFYEETVYREQIDKVLEHFTSSPYINYQSLLKPFIFTHCDDFSSETLMGVGNYISSMESYDINQIIQFLLTTSPFKECCERDQINQEVLEYLYTANEIEDTPKIDESTPTGDKIIAYAKTKLGTRYYWGASGPNYFDCSGFVYWTHNKAGIIIPRTTAAVYSKMGKPISYSQLQIGDVITFNYGSGVAHIGIYIGEGNMINALGAGSGTVGQYPNQCVKISNIKKGSYFYKYIYNCRRLY